MIDVQRLRDLADALQGCEWEVPLGSEQLCRAAADEIVRLRRAINAVRDLIADSEGVSGLHRNGEIAPWNDLLAGGKYEDWLYALSEATKGGDDGRTTTA